LNAYLWRTDQFHWWIGQRRHLLQVSEFVYQPQPRINVDQRLYPGKALSTTWPGISRCSRSKYCFGMKWLKMSIFTGKILGFEHRHFSVLVIWQAIICNFGPQVLKIPTPIKGAGSWLVDQLATPLPALPA